MVLKKKKPLNESYTILNIPTTRMGEQTDNNVKQQTQNRIHIQGGRVRTRDPLPNLDFDTMLRG